MAWLSPLYSRASIDLGHRIHALDESGAVPNLPGWRWIHTPGHTPGHVSFFRDADRVLVAGDAFVTTKQESMLGALLKPELVHGPPAYFTSDWTAARDSVRRLAALRPEVAATGHGRPMSGPALLLQLNRLANDFDQVARPKYGRYVPQAARSGAEGVIEVPPAVFPPVAALLAVGACVAVGALATGGARNE
jgi:glyoxylase-like metal-dependent hydrolase (beta-lactamase superfamily II)